MKLKKLSMFVLLLALTSCSSNSKVPQQRKVAESDIVATINCAYKLSNSKGSETEGLQIEEVPRDFSRKFSDPHYKLTYGHCFDIAEGHKYKVIIHQNMNWNLDFLKDKTVDPGDELSGVITLKCIGTNVQGKYQAGLFAGLGFGGAGRLGVFASLHSVCAVGDVKSGFSAIGAEVSAYTLEVILDK